MKKKFTDGNKRGKSYTGEERKVYTKSDMPVRCTCGEPCGRCGYRKRNIPDPNTFHPSYEPCPIHG